MRQQILLQLKFKWHCTSKRMSIPVYKLLHWQWSDVNGKWIKFVFDSVRSFFLFLSLSRAHTNVSLFFSMTIRNCNNRIQFLVTKTIGNQCLNLDNFNRELFTLKSKWIKKIVDFQYFYKCLVYLDIFVVVTDTHNML